MNTHADFRLTALVMVIAMTASVSVLGQQPNPITGTDVSSAVTDPSGRQTVVRTGRFGEVLGTTDAAGLSTAVSRDIDGNPTATTRPDGSFLYLHNRCYFAIAHPGQFAEEHCNKFAGPESIRYP